MDVVDIGPPPSILPSFIEMLVVWSAITFFLSMLWQEDEKDEFIDAKDFAQAEFKVNHVDLKKVSHKDGIKSGFLLKQSNHSKSWTSKYFSLLYISIPVVGRWGQQISGHDACIDNESWCRQDLSTHICCHG